ncbi:prolyl oligopeptidase family serine peptidase [Vulcaniibacterium tengchongense]|uniref:Putative esterase n=1 Tax=Vulcaniibacterium tengchongense TaxID=1273429 RepID=A0A3N4VVC9_9GAMM|nr:prolyl oligopeptidase family serine peptidase [Vulcaniibacterium tengchongense]RPE81007.1 putative esterase [Vulcaniibacterium tengchongense]
MLPPLPRSRHARPLRALLLVLVLATTAACVHAPRREAAGGFVERELRLDGRLHRYRVFVPTLQAGGRRPPVVLFLHGSGERGDDNVRQAEVGLGPYVRRHSADFPAIVVFPQSPRGESWTGATARMALAALDASLAEFGGDPERVVLTGISRGGYGVIELALMQPQRFAALAPVCGGITQPNVPEPLFVAAVATAPDPFAAAALKLQPVPIWLFHGARDEVVTPDQSRHLAEALRRVGADVRYTEFPDLGHDAWDAAYATPELWRWAFAQRRR